MAGCDIDRDWPILMPGTRNVTLLKYSQLISHKRVLTNGFESAALGAAGRYGKADESCEASDRRLEEILVALPSRPFVALTARACLTTWMT
jgi:hypothetical protein